MPGIVQHVWQHFRASVGRKGPEMIAIDPKSLLSFPADRARVVMTSDQAVGGFSTITLNEGAQKEGITFSGNLSLGISESITKSGYVAAIGRFPRTVNAWQFNALSMLLRTDSRTYVCNVKTQDLATEEVYQMFVSIPPDVSGEWVEVQVRVPSASMKSGRIKNANFYFLDCQLPFSRFLKSWKGYVSPSDQPPLNQRAITSVGLALMDRQEGPFEFSWKSLSLVHVHDSSIDNDAQNEGLMREDAKDAMHYHESQLKP